jgi:hypothetical protein
MTDEFERDELKPFETDCQPERLGGEISNDDRPEAAIATPEVVAGFPEVGQEPSGSEVQRIHDEGLNRTPSATASADSETQLNKLILSQLASSVPEWLTNPNSIDGAVQLYLKFEPADATESLLALLAVGLTNSSMDGLERANRAGLNSEVRQMELKLVHKGSAAVVDVLKMLHNHRRSGDQKISVGSVNVGSGGQAVVGNVQAAARKKQDEEG